MFRQAGVGKQVSVSGAPKREGAYLAQVIEVMPPDHAVGVFLPALSAIASKAKPAPLKAKVLARRAGPLMGDVDLPQRGDWGLVVFPQGSDQLAVWLGSLHQDFFNIATDNEGETIHQHDSGIYTRMDAAGTLEVSHPSGTFIRIGQGTSLATRTKQYRQGTARLSQPYAIPSKPIPDVIIEHATGAQVHMDTSGNITIQGATGKVVYAGGPSNVAAPADSLARLTWMATILAWLTSHTHGGVMPGSGTSGPPAVAPAAPVPGVDYTLNVKGA